MELGGYPTKGGGVNCYLKIEGGKLYYIETGVDDLGEPVAEKTPLVRSRVYPNCWMLPEDERDPELPPFYVRETQDEYVIHHFGEVKKVKKEE